MCRGSRLMLDLLVKFYSMMLFCTAHTLTYWKTSDKSSISEDIDKHRDKREDEGRIKPDKGTVNQQHVFECCSSICSTEPQLTLDLPPEMCEEEKV